MVPPLLLRPRLDEKPWGGDSLSRFGFDVLPGARIGEALLTAAESVVELGPLAGRTLGSIVEQYPSALLGRSGSRVTGGREIFPLLIKLIDAREDLSIQVHPDDTQAPGGSLGKTEAWYVLAAESGASIYAGLKRGVTKQEIVDLARSGHSTAHLLRQLPAEPGAVLFLPAGTVHALGGGVLIYEIQQPSAMTYRLDDWGRLGLDGKPRELHIDQGLAVLDPDARPIITWPETHLGPITTLVHCSYFAADLITGSILLPVADGPRVLTCIDGHFSVVANGSPISLSRGSTVVVPGGISSQVDLLGDSGRVLHGWIPD